MSRRPIFPMGWLGRSGGGSSGGRPASLRDVPDHGRLAPPAMDFERARVEAEMRRRADLMRVEQMNANYTANRFKAAGGFDPNWRPLPKE